MAKFARIDGDSKVVEIIEVESESLEGIFHPDVVATFVAVAEADVEIGAVKSGNAFLPKPPPTVARLRFIAPLAFRRRMTSERRAAITDAASKNATLRAFLDDLGAARVIDLDHEDTIAGVDAMIAAGLLTAEEGAALLADGQPGES